jgi:hypothetical protein
MIEEDKKDPNNNIYLSLREDRLEIEGDSIPDDVVSLEPIEEWGNRPLLYGLLNSWLTTAAFHLEDRYNQSQELPNTRFLLGIANPSNILYSIGNGTLYIPYNKMMSETVAVNPNDLIKKVSPKFTEELAKVSYYLHKYGEMRVKEDIEIPYWGEVTARILSKYTRYSNFTRQAIEVSPVQANRTTIALISMDKNLRKFKALDQK